MEKATISDGRDRVAGRGARGRAVGRTATGLDGFLDGTGPQAPGADTDILAHTADHRMDALQVRIEYPLGLIVGMADIVSRDRALAAEFTAIRHDTHSL